MSCLYVVEIGADRIKVGQSHKPRARIAAHRAAAIAHGLQPHRSWFSSPKRRIGDDEQSLIKFCRPLAAEAIGEYFVGVPFEVAVAYAQHLPSKATAARVARQVRSELAHLPGRAERAAEIAVLDQASRGEQPDYYKVPRVAVELGIPAHQIYAACRADLIPHKRFPTRLYLPAAAVAALREHGLPAPVGAVS